MKLRCNNGICKYIRIALDKAFTKSNKKNSQVSKTCEVYKLASLDLFFYY
ncbi:hypothetical protein C874_03525 [Elizabethkingia anophelis 502]|nr:hypothetical protein C874_03525 [Elizabethkingia anophelis 502]